jgi:hypothetical protein
MLERDRRVEKRYILAGVPAALRACASIAEQGREARSRQDRCTSGQRGAPRLIWRSLHVSTPFLLCDQLFA